ncbi:hypothetical protein [Methylotuvimicrobium sp.]|uniref:hypothetical protein n=1 Tax=Methylotuvimicrobium sp. TaxID=2822413 RepID=UPI003D65FF63
MRQLPKMFHSLFLRRLYFFIWLITQKSNFDIFILRYPPIDPFLLLFSPFLKPIVTVHHTKEVEEIAQTRTGLKRKAALAIEKIIGNIILKQTAAIITVTAEIYDYEIKRCGFKPKYIYPNGIDSRLIGLTGDKRGCEPEFIFVSSYFANWHGLDLFLDILEVDDSPCLLHLVGQISPADLNRIKTTDSLSQRIMMHGKLDAVEINKLMASCDLGLSSFALFRNNMREACTLKVREYLAAGLAVFSGHKDSGLPDDFAYYRHNESSLKNIISYAIATRSVERQTIRSAALPYIEKKQLLMDCYEWIQGLNT